MDSTSPSPFVGRGGQLSLDNPSQLELLRGVTERGAELRTRVRGASMAPFLRDGDVVTFRPLARRDPHVGDVVAVSLGCGRRMAVHRVVARDPGGWLVRGDNCKGPDGVFPRDSLVGRVVRVEREKRDVHLGLGVEAAVLAVLSRQGWLVGIRRVRNAPLQAAARSLRAVQGVSAYRTVVRRLVPRVHIAEATPADRAVLFTRLRMRPGSDAREALLAGRLWVARHGRRVIGYVGLVEHMPGESPLRGPWLYPLVVWRPCRGQGVGEALVLHAARAVVREVDVERLWLRVLADDEPILAVCEKVGFVRATPSGGERSLSPGNERRRIVMALGLEPISHTGPSPGSGRAITEGPST